MKLFLIIALLLFIFWSGYQTRQHPQLKFNSLTDRIANPLDTRLRYRIAEVDLICAELAGDFHLGYARQLTDKSSLLFDLAF
nr:hypothetical protein F987_03158 [Acinetobacter gyllenbergii NIPH 230]